MVSVAAAGQRAQEFPVSGYIAVVLGSETDIREEWAAMRNCALDHVAACRRGTHRAVSLRDRDTGERIVTVILKRDGGRYVALDARRRFNRPGGPELWQAAQRVAAICSGASTAAVARRATQCRRSSRTEKARSSEMLIGSQAAFDFDGR